MNDAQNIGIFLLYYRNIVTITIIVISQKHTGMKSLWNFVYVKELMIWLHAPSLLQLGIMRVTLSEIINDEWILFNLFIWVYGYWYRPGLHNVFADGFEITRLVITTIDGAILPFELAGRGSRDW